LNTEPGQPDPTLYIDRLLDEDAFCREAAAWSLGEIGDARAARPLAGLILRELQAEPHEEVVRAAAGAIARLGATDALYALVKALCAFGRAVVVEEETVVDVVEALGEVGGPNAVREATERLVRETAGRPHAPGLAVVCHVLLERLGLCGDAAVATLKRLARGGPDGIRPIAQRVYTAL
jgi:HEAT repeat protein